MPDNATLNQLVQIGMQSVFNTGVAATKRIQSMNIALDAQLNTDTFAPNGNLFPTSAALIQEWTEGDLDGILTYTEVVYPLTALLGPAVITTFSGGPLAKQWLWTVNANSVLSPTFLSIEKGSSVYAVQVINAVLTGLNFGWKRTDKVSMGGGILASRLQTGFTMTTIGGSPTVEIVRVLPPHIDVFFDASYAGLGTSKQLRAFEAAFSLDNMYSPVWPLNSALTGHDGVVPTMPDSESSMLLMADANGLAFLANVRANTTGYLRIKATGPLIEAVHPYVFQIDIPVQVKDVDGFTDSDGVWAIPWTFQPIDNGTNAPLVITVINKQTAL